MQVELTKSAEQSLIYLYKECEHKIRNGVPKQQAMRFVDGEQNFSKIKEFISADILELKRAGLVKYFVDGSFDITTSGIIYVEKLPKETFEKFLSIIAQFHP